MDNGIFSFVMLMTNKKKALPKFATFFHYYGLYKTKT